MNVRLSQIDELKIHLGDLKNLWVTKEDEIEQLKQELRQLNYKKNYYAKNLVAPQSASKAKKNNNSNSVFQTPLDADSNPNRSTAFFGSSGKKPDREEYALRVSHEKFKEENMRFVYSGKFPFLNNKYLLLFFF